MPSYKQQVIDNKWDAIVIGSGIGGLATAALLSKYAGKRVLVLERHYAPGGYTHSFNRPGYSWDVGVHYIGEVQSANSPVRAVFDHLTDGQLHWQPMPTVYDRVVFGNEAGRRTFDFPSGLENLRASLKQAFPSERSAIDSYLAAVHSAQKSSGLYYAEKAIPRPIARLAGGLMRAPFLKWASQTTLDVLHRWTRNPELIGVLTAQWGDYGLPPAQSSFGMHAMVASHYFNGASYPVGGSSRIAETITPLIERTGGKVVVGAEVAEVVVSDGKATGVRMADGREFLSSIVISDAGARNTFERLAPIKTDLGGIPGSMAHLSLYVGVRQTAAELGLNGTNLWIYPTPDHDANMARFLKDPSAPFPALFISFPSAKDPLFESKHPGRATVEVVTFVPYATFAQFEDTTWKRRGPEYDALKSCLAERLRRELELAVPSIAGKIDHAELSTPLTTRHFMNYRQGEAYGLAATPERFRSRSLTPHTPIRNLFLTGQDVTSLGVAGAMMGGVVAASAILGRNLMSKVTKPL